MKILHYLASRDPSPICPASSRLMVANESHIAASLATYSEYAGKLFP